MATALTREQKLLAEIVVQLGNITEAIQSAAAGEDSSVLNAKDRRTAVSIGCCILCPCRSSVNNWLKRKLSMLNFKLNWLRFTKVTLRLTTLHEVMETLGIEHDG